MFPNLPGNKNKQIFRAMNMAFIIGGLSLILTFLFMIVNSDNADRIVLFCLPGFAFGLVLMILYVIGHHKLTKVNKQLRFEKSISFGK